MKKLMFQKVVQTSTIPCQVYISILNRVVLQGDFPCAGKSPLPLYKGKNVEAEKKKYQRWLDEMNKRIKNPLDNCRLS